MSAEAIQQWLDLQPTNIRKTVEFVSAEEAGPMYHMSLDGDIKKFTPYVTRRTGNKENISVPRISVAPTIMGCFIGYCAAWSDITWPDTRNKKAKNGWYLYDIPYEYAVSPDKKQLYDVDDTDEHWLVTYSPETREYKGNIVAKMFYAELKMVPRTGKTPQYLVKLVIDVQSEKGLKLGEDVILEKGQWMIDGPSPESHGVWSDLKPYTINKIGYGEYAKLKGLSADMLSLNPPPAFKW